MNRSNYSGMLPWLLLWCVCGCAVSEEETIISHELQVQLDHCLGSRSDVESPDDCSRKAISQFVDSMGDVGACLIFQIDQNRTQVRTGRWENGTVKVSDERALEYEPGRSLSVRLKLMQGLVDDDACETTAFDQCDGECLLLLADDFDSAPNGGRLVIDFGATAANGGGCQSNWNLETRPEFKETCDAVDNDCDGRVDELGGQILEFDGQAYEMDTCCATDSSCRDALNRFDVFCDEGTGLCRGCSSHDDCAMLAGAVSIEKPFCNPENGLCGECDVNTLQADSGCDIPEVCRRSGDVKGRNFCGRCEVDGDCDDGLYCLTGLDPGNPSNETCQECIPNVSGMSPDCSIHPDRPFCAESGQCVECLPRSDGVSDVCDTPDAPLCIAEGGGFVCGPCRSNSDCIALNEAWPFCDVENTGRCNGCENGTRNGCSGATPTCDANEGICRPCVSDDDCDGNRCVQPRDDMDCSGDDVRLLPEECLNIGHCEDCESDGDCQQIEGGDSGLNYRPVCRNRACSPCLSNRDCEGTDTPECNPTGNCSECRVAEDQNGQIIADAYRCAEDGSTPICDDQGSCRACENDAECIMRPGGLNVCVDGQCTICDTGDGRGCTAEPFLICAESRGNPLCVECIDSADCDAGFSCTDFRCLGGCDPGTNTPCAMPTPVCAGDRSCRVCRPEDCGREDLIELCRDSDACLYCLDLGGNSTSRDGSESPNDVAAARQEVNQQGYGCDEFSSAPICDRGECRGCETDEECESRPGLSNVCAMGQRAMPSNRVGQCVECEDSSFDRPDRGCTDDVRFPHCLLTEGRMFCAECSSDQHCTDGTVCARGRCVVCDPSTNNGCPYEAPVCRSNLGRFRCETCQTPADCRPTFCNSLNENCVSTAVCTGGGICQECSPGRTCFDGSPCTRDGRCGDCRNLGEECPAVLECDRSSGTCLSPDRCCDPRFENCDPLAESCFGFQTCERGVCQYCRPGSLCHDGQICVYLDNLPAPFCQFCSPGECPDGMVCEVGLCVGAPALRERR